MDTTLARQQLDRLIRLHGTSYAAVSRLLGRNAAYVQQYVRRGSPTRLEEQDRKLLSTFFGVDEAVLKGKAGPEVTVPGQDTVMRVPRLDVQVSAGLGAEPSDEIKIGHYVFDRHWLRDVSRGNLDDLSIVRVRGDSMVPTLADGDDVLVDQVDGSSPLRDGIHVLQRDDTLLVKRLALNPATGRLTITSDNPAYPTHTDCAPDEVRVLGRVVWVGRRLG